jgi:hypothetical protein
MTVQLSDLVRNARLDAIETVIGASPTLEIRTGAQPASCAAADSGSVLATIALPSDWMLAASGGSKALSGTWTDASADATGTAGHFRIKSGATTHLQGSVGTSAADLICDSTAFTAAQSFTISAFTLNDPNS